MGSNDKIIMIIESLRSSCVICNNNLEEIFLLKEMPVYMGHNEGNTELFSDMTFMKCVKCGTPQIKEILNPELVYMRNHNKLIIGETWTNHFDKLSEFIKPHILNKNVLEIGDPSYKVSSNLSIFSKKWYIVEPNPDDSICPNNVELIKGYFNKETNINTSIDVIFHSHLLEHLTSPSTYLNLFYDKLSDDGKLIFSVPNFEKLLENQQPVNNILNFEHTYYFNFNSMSSFLKSHGFKVDEYSHYNDHSIFFICSKKQKENDVFVFDSIEQDFFKSLSKFKSWVNDVNQRIKHNTNVYLYGCHISTQFVLNLGLVTNNIKCILDNSKVKQGNVLYGTKLLTVSPETILNDEEPIVIVNHMSIYSDEIKKQLLELNTNVKLL